jgi:hypothetical protein
MGNNLLVVFLLVASVSTIDLSGQHDHDASRLGSLIYYVDIGAGVAVMGAALRTATLWRCSACPTCARVGFGRAFSLNEIVMAAL